MTRIHGDNLGGKVSLQGTAFQFEGGREVPVIDRPGFQHRRNVAGQCVVREIGHGVFVLLFIITRSRYFPAAVRFAPP